MSQIEANHTSHLHHEADSCCPLAAQFASLLWKTYKLKKHLTTLRVSQVLLRDWMCDNLQNTSRLNSDINCRQKLKEIFIMRWFIFLWIVKYLSIQRIWISENSMNICNAHKLQYCSYIIFNWEIWQQSVLCATYLLSIENLNVGKFIIDHERFYSGEQACKN